MNRFENYRALFKDYELTEMDHAIRINGVADIHRNTPYVFDIVNNEHKKFDSYQEAVEYLQLIVTNSPARDAYRKLETGRMSYKEFTNSKKWKRTLDHPENYHWNNQLHEKSQDHLYIMTNGEGVKIGRSYKPSQRLKSLQTGSHAKIEILCIIKHKGFLEKTLHKCFSDIRLSGEWFSNSIRIAKFMNLTKDWHIQ